MTKQKSKVVSKHRVKRRSTFKRHSKKYMKVYSPYLPVVVGLLIGLGLVLSSVIKQSSSVLNYATDTSVSSLLEQTNERRTENQLDDLELDKRLSHAAQLKARDMASANYWSHVSPQGKQPWYFIDKSGYKYAQAAENLAYGFTSSEDTINGWMNSYEHREAMLNDNFADVGFGIANSKDYQGKGNQTIVVAIYGKPQKPKLTVVNSDFTKNSASSISLGQVITKGNWPWINLISGIIIGVISMYLIAKHSLKLRRKIRQGEEYILHHPAVDMSLLLLLLILVLLSRTVGFVQ